MLMKQPNGLPLQHLCITIGQSAKNKYAITEGLKSGQVNNVSKEFFFKLRAFFKTFFRSNVSMKHFLNPLESLQIGESHTVYSGQDLLKISIF